MSRFARWMEALDTREFAYGALVFCACMAMLWQPSTGGFAAGGKHEGVSYCDGAVAQNLSWDTGFMQQWRMWIGDEGEVHYVNRGRFPITVYAIYRLVSLPFSDQLHMQITASRRAALLILLSAMLVAYLTASRLVKSPVLALGPVLLAFSSYYFTYYSGLVSYPIPGLLGAALALHGIVAYQQGASFRRLRVDNL